MAAKNSISDKTGGVNEISFRQGNSVSELLINNGYNWNTSAGGGAICADIIKSIVWNNITFKILNPTQKGYLWTAQRVGNMIKNPVYKGYIRYGYTTQRVVSRDGLIFNKKTTVNKDGDYILSKGVHELIVSEELWELANKKAFDGVPDENENKKKNS